MSDTDDIVIGEGVALEAGAAPVTLRILSGAIDFVVYLLAAFVLLRAAGPIVSSVSVAWAAAIVVILSVTMLVFVPATVETLSRGRSLGRLAAGLRVVRDDGGPVSVRHAIARSFVGLIEIYGTAGTVAIVVSLLSSRGKRIGDYLAGTYAMRTRGAKSQLPPVVMPPHLAAWARAADVSRLPDGLALTSRLFLARAHQMRPESHARIAHDLAAAVRTHVAPPPPEGTTDDDCIAAVLAERRDREWRVETQRARRAAAEDARIAALPFAIPDAEN